MAGLPKYYCFKPEIKLEEGRLVVQLRPIDWQDLVEDEMSPTRCGECRQFDDTGYSNPDSEMPMLRMGHCRILGRDVQACWFCGSAERREGGTP